jgi:hypothetical protein
VLLAALHMTVPSVSRSMVLGSKGG